MLRSMVAVNVLLAAAAVIRAPSLDAVPGQMLAFAAFGEPMLIVSLVVLCAARTWLLKLGYGGAYALIAVFEVALAWAFHEAAEAEQWLHSGADSSSMHHRAAGQ